MLELGPVIVWPTSLLPARFRRTARMIRRSDPEQYHLSLVLGGELGFDHAGRSDMYGPRDLWVSDTSRPYDVRPPDGLGRRTVTGVGVEVPKALLPVSPDRVRELLGRRLSAQEGVGALLTGFLTGLERESNSSSRRTRRAWARSCSTCWRPGSPRCWRWRPLCRRRPVTGP